MDVSHDAVVASHRDQINATDLELLRGLNRRAELVASLHAHKRARGYATLDRDRERELIDHLRDVNPGPLSGDAVERVYRVLLDQCSAAAARTTEAASPG